MTAADDDSPGSIHALMQGLIDYAGLFPPAKLDMPAAVRRYAEHLASDDAWMLGRFILPVSRLEEFRRAGTGVLPRDPEANPWPISAIVDGDLAENLDSIYAFNREHAQASNGSCVIDALEIKVPVDESGEPSAAFVDDALDRVPDELFPFFELPVLAGTPDGKSPSPPDPRGCLAVLSEADAGAKVRTGGVNADAFPSCMALAEFLAACAAADVPFKATAGLHHAVRAEHPLTYEPHCPRPIMHGFLNVFVAACLLRAGHADAARAAQILAETDPRAFTFEPHRLRWRELYLPFDAIEDARAGFALSYGSCSFHEPTAELQQLGLL